MNTELKNMILQRKAKLGIGFITLLGVVLLVSLIGWITMRPEPEIIQGEVEADEVRVSSKIPSRVGKILVEEGQAVTKGQLLVELLAPEIYAKLEQAEAAESGARAQAEKAEHGTRQELVEGAFEQWQKAKAGLEIAQKSFDRAKKLFDGEVISAQKYDEAQALLNAATATEKAAKSQYTMAKNGAQREDQLAAKSLVDRARGAVSEVKAYLPETQLEAPIAGEVSEIFPKQGELVGQGAPIMNIVDLSSCRVSFNLRENLLTKIRQGTELTVTVPALGDQEFKVKVNYIKALGGYATWRATKVSGEFDVRTFEVRAKPEKAIEGLRPGMSVILKTEL